MGFSTEPSIRAAGSSKRHSGKVATTLRCRGDARPDRTEKVMRRVLCKQYAISINNHIPPFQHSSPMALAHTEGRIAPHRNTRFPGVGFVRPRRLLSGRPPPYCLNPCIKHYRLEPIASFPGCWQGLAVPNQSLIPLLPTNTDATGLLHAYTCKPVQPTHPTRRGPEIANPTLPTYQRIACRRSILYGPTRLTRGYGDHPVHIGEHKCGIADLTALHVARLFSSSVELLSSICYVWVEAVFAVCRATCRPSIGI